MGQIFWMRYVQKLHEDVRHKAQVELVAFGKRSLEQGEKLRGELALFKAGGKRALWTQKKRHGTLAQLRGQVRGVKTWYARRLVHRHSPCVAIFPCMRTLLFA